MNREQIEELAALDALGALDGEDAAAWERIRMEDADATRVGAEMSDFAARLTLLATADSVAPAALRRRVMERVFGGESPIHEAGTPAGPSFGAGAWAAAAAILLLALAGAASTMQLKESVVVQDRRPDPSLPFVPLGGYGDYAGAKASVLWDSGQRGWYVQADGLPALPSSHSYRLWEVDAEGRVHDCGELPLRAGGSARRFVKPEDGFDTMLGFAVTIEPAGSKPAAPSTPAVLVSALL